MGKAALKRLVKEIPPPSQPRDAVGDWVAVEAKLKFWLPQDYKDFIATYGSGRFDPCELCVPSFLIWDPDPGFSATRGELFADESSESSPEYQQSIELFSWGADAVGSEFYWAQEGHPDDWYVVLRKGSFYPIPGLSLTDFLVELFLEKSPELASLWNPGSLRPQTFFPAP